MQVTCLWLSESTASREWEGQDFLSQEVAGHVSIFQNLQPEEWDRREEVAGHVSLSFSISSTQGKGPRTGGCRSRVFVCPCRGMEGISTETDSHCLYSGCSCIICPSHAPACQPCRTKPRNTLKQRNHVRCMRGCISINI